MTNTSNRRAFFEQASAVGFGLLSSSAILVHLSGGLIELHFHFFVMLVFLTAARDASAVVRRLRELYSERGEPLKVAAVDLRSCIEHAVALAGSDRLEVDDLPPRLLTGYEHIILPSIRRQDTMREWAARYARLVLERCQNNKRRACRELGISYHTLQGHLRYGTRPRGLSSGPQ